MAALRETQSFEWFSMAPTNSPIDPVALMALMPLVALMALMVAFVLVVLVAYGGCGTEGLCSSTMFLWSCGPLEKPRVSNGSYGAH